MRRHGDVFELTSRGYYHAHGRADDTMNLGGIKVSFGPILNMCSISCKYQHVVDLSLLIVSLMVGQVSSVEIERICNGVDSNVLETAAIGVPPAGGGPEELVIAVVFRDSNKPSPDLHQLRISFNSALQKTLNPLFKVIILVPSEFLSFL